VLETEFRRDLHDGRIAAPVMILKVLVESMLPPGLVNCAIVALLPADARNVRARVSRSVRDDLKNRGWRFL